MSREKYELQINAYYQLQTINNAYNCVETKSQSIKYIRQIITKEVAEEN